MEQVDEELARLDTDRTESNGDDVNDDDPVIISSLKQARVSTKYYRS